MNEERIVPMDPNDGFVDRSTSPIEGIHFSYVYANGIHHRLASSVKLNDADNRARTAPAPSWSTPPLILFLHGFPESWYSWRHQLLYFKAKGVVAVAPDMRGYGGSATKNATVIGRPGTTKSEYTQPVLARDVVSIAQCLGYHRFILIGHDWGAALAWNVALLYPSHVTAVCALSIPYAGIPKNGTLSMLQAKHGYVLDQSYPRKERERATFHYVLHHCLPRASEVYDENISEILYRLYTARPHCRVQPGTPEYNIDGLMFPSSGNAETDRIRILDATAAPGLWLRLPRPVTFPDWLTQRDLDYYIGEFKRTGFAGGLSWYQAMDESHEQIQRVLRRRQKNGEVVDDHIYPPSLFIMGERDYSVLSMYGGKAKITARVKSKCEWLTRDPIFLPDCGHWIQQEKHTEINQALAAFIKTVLAIPSSRSTREDDNLIKSKL